MLGLLRIVTYCLVVTLSYGAQAQPKYPSQTVRLVVPFPAGGQTDIVARLIADDLSRSFNAAFIVENVTGASGNIGTTMVERAQPDGHTLLVVPPSFVTNLLAQKAIQKLDAWQPITVAGTVPYLLVAGPQGKAATIGELIASARSRPGEVSYASSGVGSSSHLCVLAIETLAGVKFAHVPYRGLAPALTDVMNGHVDFIFDSMATSYPLWKDGKVRVLGTGSHTRVASMPDVPTFGESGLPGFEASTWTAILAPPGTPDYLIDVISVAMRAALRKESVVERMNAMFINVTALDPAASREFLKSEASFWGKIDQPAP